MLFMTGGAFTESALEFLGRPAIRHVGKPVDSMELRRLVLEVAGPARA